MRSIKQHIHFSISGVKFRWTTLYSLPNAALWTFQEINCCSETECSPPLAEVGEMQILKKCSQVTNFTEAPATFNFSNTLDVENVSSYYDACPIGTTACVETVRVSSEEWMESFTAYMAVRIIIDILRASSLMLFEGAVVVIIKVRGEPSPRETWLD